jgi:hypothetical protein
MMARARKAAEEDLVDVEDVDDDEAQPFSTAQFIDPNWKPPAPKPPGERKVTNKYIPLFPDATKNPRHHAASIKVYKTSPPDDGYKGETGSPETVDEAYIASLWGDGIFRLELLDQSKNVLRTRDNVKVSTGGGPSKTNGHSNGHGGEDLKSILTSLTDRFAETLKTVTESAEKRLEREEKRLADERAAERERSKEHVTTLGTLIKGEADQLRLHYSAQAQAADSQSKMLLSIMTTSHQQTMAMMLQSSQQQLSRSDPLLFLRVFQEGMNNGGEGDAAGKVTDNIVKGLESLRGLAGGNGGGGGLPGGAPPEKKLPAGGAPKNGDVKKNGATAKPAAGGGAKLLTKDELREFVILKQTLKKRGMSDEQFLSLVKQARAEYANPNDAPIDEFVDDEDDDDPDAETDEERAERLKKRKKPDAPADPAEQPADDVEREGSADA